MGRKTQILILDHVVVIKSGRIGLPKLIRIQFFVKHFTKSSLPYPLYSLRLPQALKLHKYRARRKTAETMIALIQRNLELDMTNLYITKSSV